MGNHLSQNELDEADDFFDVDERGDSIEISLNADLDFEGQPIALPSSVGLQRMVHSILRNIPRQFTRKMPLIRKRPDTTNFRNTSLYQEIKCNSGLPPNNKVPTDRWSLEKHLINRENGVRFRGHDTFTDNQRRLMSNLYVPNHKEERLMSLESKIFISKFNKDGSKLITASQDNIIRVFDSSKGTYHRINRITGQDVSWCILDVDFSPCGKSFVYSTWSDYFVVVPLVGATDEFQWYHLNTDTSRSCVFSVRFSPCGSSIIGGCNDSCIHIANRETTQIKQIKTDNIGNIDINAISYIDDSSSKVFVSGCDNGVIKLWDTRCLGGRPEPVGVFLGHFDGVTYIDSRNDGRYILSNSKDQSIKIWDLRRPSPKDKENSIKISRSYNWDYRWDNVPRDFYNPQKSLDGDASVMTYRGHRVTKSLIRAKFSPLEQTGQRYIYTGCGTGRVIIYDVLTGHIKEAIEGHKDIVRDVSWHPVRSEIISSAWDSHVNLNTFKRMDLLKRSSSGGMSDEERPLRRSRRIAEQRNESHDTELVNQA